MTPRARAATPADLAAAVCLLEEAAAAVGLERGGRVHVQREFPPSPLHEHLAALLDDPTACVAVGTVEDVIVGVAIARTELLRDDTRLARLEALWVEPDAREVGLGEELIGLVGAWAEGLGATCLDAYALPGSRETKNFLEAAGFSARLIVMHRRLGHRPIG